MASIILTAHFFKSRLFALDSGVVTVKCSNVMQLRVLLSLTCTRTHEVQRNDEITCIKQFVQKHTNSGVKLCRQRRYIHK
jgi:hypothetical protein